MARSPRFSASPSSSSRGGIVAMLQKRQLRRSKRPLALERLEDRLVLSGNVIVLPDLTGTGKLQIFGDNGNNAFCISETNNLGQPTLTILGNPTIPAIPGVPPGNFTAINTLIGGCV